MKTQFILLTVATILFSCSKKSESLGSVDTSATLNATTSPEGKRSQDSSKATDEKDTGGIKYQDYTGVIIHSCEIYKEKSMESDVLARVKQGLQVKINEKSESKAQLSTIVD